MRRGSVDDGDWPRVRATGPRSYDLRSAAAALFDAVPGVASRVPGVRPLEIGLHLRFVPVALEVGLDVLEPPAVVLRAGFPAVAVRRGHVVVADRRIVIGTCPIVLTPVRILGSGIDGFGYALA